MYLNQKQIMKMEKQLIRITAEKLTRNFTHKEWSLAKYSDKTSYEAPTALIYAVQAIRDWFQGKVLITSTLRKSDKFGFHRLGLAVDLVPSNECLYTMNDYFDELFTSNPLVYAFGEDLGNIGDVNQGFAGLQIKHGADRIFDTGIREQSIMGQAHGMAMRGLRPIAEIQYLDYLLYGLQTLSDDVATLHYRSNGLQSSPVIIRTRGHRLEGIFHSGSPMGVIINALRGMYICVPRNMVQAVGMYNTLLAGNDPALLIECLNGYRLKEQMPTNLMSFKVALGVPEIIREGNDITIVSYGSTIRIIEDAALRLAEMGIDCEIIDVQTLLPFDIHHQILASLKKTNRIVFVDEDVPGGGSAYMYQQVLEVQGGYKWLDATARTISAKAHRPAYASDGDYFSKPNTEEIIEKIKEMMAE